MFCQQQYMFCCPLGLYYFIRLLLLPLWSVKTLLGNVTLLTQKIRSIDLSLKKNSRHSVVVACRFSWPLLTYKSRSLLLLLLTTTPLLCHKQMVVGYSRSKTSFHTRIPALTRPWHWETTKKPKQCTSRIQSWRSWCHDDEEYHCLRPGLCKKSCAEADECTRCWWHWQLSASHLWGENIWQIEGQTSCLTHPWWEDFTTSPST